MFYIVIYNGNFSHTTKKTRTSEAKQRPADKSQTRIQPPKTT